MSSLRSVLDDVSSLDTAELSNSELAAELAEVIHARQSLDVLLAAWMKTLADRGGHVELGYSSPTAFLVDHSGSSPGRAKQVISMGNAKERAPHAYSAWADGRISTDQARHLFQAAESIPDAYADAEERLVAIVEGLDAVDTAKAVEYWRQSVDGPGDLDPETRWARRGLNLSKSIKGMRRVDGWLTEVAGEALEATLDANMPPPRDGDTRTPRQRRHDAASRAALEP